MELIRLDVKRAVGDAVYFAKLSDERFYSNPMLWTASEPVILPAFEGPR